MRQHRETSLDVTGMTCASCVRHVDHALNALEGVERVEVRLGEGKVLIRHDPALASTEQLIAAITQAGYEARAA